MNKTYFIRAKKERNYTVLDNTFINDDKLSWKAKGVFTYILSLPEDWKIYLTELETHATDGKDSLRNAINELVKAGYIVIEELKDKGKFAGYSYTIIENPSIHSGKSATDKNDSENPKSEKYESKENNPKSENPQLLNTNNTKYSNKQSTEEQNSKKPEKSDVTKLKESYYQTYLNMMKREPCTKEDSTAFWKTVMGILKKKLKEYDLNTLLKVLEYATNEDWVIAGGFIVSTVFCDTVIQRTIQNAPHGKPQKKKEPVKNYVTYTNTEKVDTSDCPF